MAQWGAGEAHRKCEALGAMPCRTRARASIRNTLYTNAHTHTGMSCHEKLSTHSSVLLPLRLTVPVSPGVPSAGRAERERRAQSRDVLEVLDQMTEPVHEALRRLAALT